MKISNYETDVYIVSYQCKNTYRWWSETFKSEELALYFIKENVSKFSNYIMVKQQKAIIEE